MSRTRVMAGGEPKRVFVISGVSGAGKSQALKVFEDFGWFCVDNLPIALLDEFARLVVKSPTMTRVALGMDVREGRLLAVLIEVASLNQRLRSQGYFSAETFNKRLIERMNAKERA